MFQILYLTRFCDFRILEGTSPVGFLAHIFMKSKRPPMKCHREMLEARTMGPGNDVGSTLKLPEFS